jgi:hypothetical protein
MIILACHGLAWPGHFDQKGCAAGERDARDKPGHDNEGEIEALQ